MGLGSDGGGAFGWGHLKEHSKPIDNMQGICQHWFMKPIRRKILDLKGSMDAALAKAPDDCWMWPFVAKDSRNDYGRLIAEDGRITRAHRHLWQLYNGPIPPGAMVCHRCDTAGCVNPNHLYLGDHKSNMRDKAIRERCHNTKITNAQVAQLRDLRKRGWKHKDLAKKFGISITLSVRICRGERRQHV